MIYLLSILDGLGGSAIFLSISSSIISVVSFCVYMSALGQDRYETRSYGHDPGAYEPRAPRLVWMVKRSAVSGAAFAVIAGLIPSRNDLISSYLMVEGSKLVTADNAQKTTEEIVKRIDAVLARFGVKP